MNARTRECVAKSLWHAMIAAVGVYEYRNQKSALSKILAIGLVAFHIDATFADLRDRPTTLQRLLNMT